MRPKPPNWWRARYQWAIAHKGTSLILAVMLCFVGGYFKYWLDHRYDYIDTRVEKVLSAPDGVKATLSKLEQSTAAADATLKTLSPFIQDVIRHQFESASKLSAVELQQRLPAIKDLLAIAKDQNVKVEPELPARLGEKLLHVHADAPDYWSVAGDLISYRSFNQVAWTRSENPPDCADLPPVITTENLSFMLDGRPQKLQAKLGEYRECRITLDSPRDAERLNSTLFGGVSTLAFYRCLIVYRGGPINITLAWNNHVVDSIPTSNGKATTMSVTGNSLLFSDCLFDFSIQQASPPEDVEWFTKLVLSQNAPAITLPLAGHS